jgi:purine-binding chemotaxis protein CheW
MPKTRPKRSGEIDWADVRRRLSAVLSPALADTARLKATLDERARLLARVPEVTSPEADRSLPLMTFLLGGERYAIEAAHVECVVRLRDLTRLPGAPARLLGLTNLRGEILPVFDLRVLLELPGSRPNDMSYLIVLGDQNGAELGFLADSVHEMISLPARGVLPPPEVVPRVARSCMHGVTSAAMCVLDARALLSDPRLWLDDTEVFSQGSGERS